MNSGEIVKELELVITYQNEHIRELNIKLENFDSVVRERDDLRELYKQFGQNDMEMKIQSREVFEDLLSKYELQTKTLKKVATAEYQCEVRNEKLQDDINDMNHELKILKCNENKLQSELAESETRLKCVQDELCTTKLKLEEKNRMITKLETNFKAKEQELHAVSRELDEWKIKCNKLDETCENLNMDLKATNKILSDTKLTAKHIEETFKLDREQLSNELEISCKKINDLEICYDEAQSELNSERCTIKTFYEKIIELNNTNEKTCLETKKQLSKLHNNLFSLKEKIDELEQLNDSKDVKINILKNKLNDRECQLKQMCLLSEKINQIEKKVEVSCAKNITETDTDRFKEKTNVHVCCRWEDSTIHRCCSACGKAIIQKDCAKANASKDNIHKTILNNLICELKTLLHNSF